MSLNDDSQPPPWYRQFWPWFLIAFPLTAVVGGIATIIIAVSTSDGLVVDDYYRRGLAINRELARDQVAEQLGLNAQIGLDASADRVEVRSMGLGALGSEPLNLRFLHPTRGNQDHNIRLIRIDTSLYTGKFSGAPPGHWHVLLEPENRRWRLVGRLSIPGESATRLLPANLIP
jgi:hypothetical protein